MKYKILFVLLILITGTVALITISSTSSSSSNESSTIDEAVNRVYPEGEGRLYEDNTAAVTAGTSNADTTAKPTEQASSQSATTKPTAAATTAATNPTTQPTTNRNGVPADSITGANLNPNLSAIQGAVAAQVNAATLKSISFSESSLTIIEGESREVVLRCDPENATNKVFSLALSNNNAKVKISGARITVTGVNAGTCRLTASSNNGHKATCEVTIRRVEQEITDDTKLPHSRLCTSANAQRWATAITQDLQALGIRFDGGLHAAGFSVNTANYPGDYSFNEMRNLLVSQARSDAQSLLVGNRADYDFNCVPQIQSNGELSFIISINKRTE